MSQQTNSLCNESRHQVDCAQAARTAGILHLPVCHSWTKGFEVLSVSPQGAAMAMGKGRQMPAMEAAARAPPERICGMKNPDRLQLWGMKTTSCSCVGWKSKHEALTSTVANHGCSARKITTSGASQFVFPARQQHIEQRATPNVHAHMKQWQLSKAANYAATCLTPKLCSLCSTGHELGHVSWGTAAGSLQKENQSRSRRGVPPRTKAAAVGA